MKKLSLLILVLCVTVNLFSTGQIGDNLIYNNRKEILHTYLLEPLFEKNPQMRPKTRCSSTGLWRNYIATFEIQNKQLIIKDIQLLQVNNKAKKFYYTSIINKTFPNKADRKIKWFTGLMESCYGEIIRYERFDLPVYENYSIYEVNNGSLIRVKHFNYKQYNKFKLKQYHAFIKTTEYKKLVKGHNNPQRSNAYTDDIKMNIIKYSTKILVK